jgi:tetratricopeptide (TPR) repeat protein
MLRASELLGSALDDERGAFDMLRQALLLLPKSDEVYAALLELAEKQTRLDSLDAHLSRLIDEAIDSSTAVALLRRRGALLEGPLNRFQDAAAVYTKLLQLRPDDAQASDKLRKSLRQSGRHQDLLLALNKQLQRTRDPETRIATLKEIALTWEHDLKNRWEALDAWKAVLREGPQDLDAVTAVQRLERGRASTPDSDRAGDDEATPTEARLDEQSPAASVESDQTVSSDETQADAESTPRHGTSKRKKNAAMAREPEPDASDGSLDDIAAADVETPPAAAGAMAGAAQPQTTSPPSATSAEVPSAQVSTLPGLSSPSATDAGATTPEPSEPEGDLDALDAAMSATRARLEEVDVFDAAQDIAAQLEVERPAAPRSSSVPPPPPLPAHAAPATAPSAPQRAASLKALLPGARPSAAAPQVSRRPAPPPPLPSHPARRSVAPPLPSQGPPPIEPAPSSAPRPRTPSKPPPLPSARASSQPPPLPAARTGSQPPPLPSQRKQD